MLIKTKWIENDAVTDAKMKLRSAQSLRSRNAAGSADISLIRLNVYCSCDSRVVCQSD